MKDEPKPIVTIPQEIKVRQTTTKTVHLGDFRYIIGFDDKNLFVPITVTEAKVPTDPTLALFARYVHGRYGNSVCAINNDDQIPTVRHIQEQYGPVEFYIGPAAVLINKQL